MYKTLMFDLDMTLLDFHKAERKALRNTLEFLGLEAGETTVALYHKINDAQWKLLEKGLVTREKLKVDRFALLFQELGVTCSPEEAAKAYEMRLAQGFYYMDGALELLEALKGKYWMCIISNGLAHVQHSRLEGADLEKYFDMIFISEEVGYNKPDQRFFDACIEKIEEATGEVFRKEEALVIGDSLSSDIAGGRNAQIDTVWFSPEALTEDVAEEQKPTYHITRLEQLLEIV